MKTITFYSYKGGVGRTLALSNIASRLAEFGKKVFIIDFDLEAPGVPYKFNNFNLKTIKRGIVDYIADYVSGKEIPSSIKKFTYSLSVGQNNITLLPAGSNYTSEYWAKLSSINWNELFYKPNGQGIEFFLDLKNKILQEFNPDFLLVDSRTGITEISGITISIFADEVVLFLANNKESIEGTAQVIRSILSPDNQLINQPPKINVALCRIPYLYGKEEIFQDEFIKKSATQKINSFFKGHLVKYNLDDLILIHSDRELEIQEKFKIGFNSLMSSDLGGAVDPVSISTDYLSLFEKITREALTEAEIARFNTIKTSELVLERAKNIEDSGKKIQMLKSAIELNGTYSDAYIQLILTFINISNLQEAEKYLFDLLKFNADSVVGAYLKGVIYFRTARLDKALESLLVIYDIAKGNRWAEPLMLCATTYVRQNKIGEAMKVCNELMTLIPDTSNIYNLMANTLRLSGKYADALKYVYRAIELDPKNPIAYGTLGEINAHLNNNEEFYLNLELSLIFRIDFERILKEESIYEKYYGEERFINLLKKYNVDYQLSLNKS